MSTRSTIWCDDNCHLFTELVPDFVGAEIQVELPVGHLIDQETFRVAGGGCEGTVVVALPKPLLLAIARRYAAEVQEVTP